VRQQTEKNGVSIGTCEKEGIDELVNLETASFKR
jgi:hypothetical protein